jgi:uncharacterized protein involved in response to NO
MTGIYPPCEYLRPWKLCTFSIGLALLIAGAFYFKTPDWDVGISGIMGTLAYLTAPWALHVVREKRWRYLPLAVFLYLFTVDGSHVLYNAWQGHPVSQELRAANFFVSTLLYILCGLIWYPEKYFAELWKMKP